MVILLAAMLALPGKPGHALLELEKDVDRAEAILEHASLERAARLETATDEMAADVMLAFPTRRRIWTSSASRCRTGNRASHVLVS